MSLDNLLLQHALGTPKRRQQRKTMFGSSIEGDWKRNAFCSYTRLAAFFYFFLISPFFISSVPTANFPSNFCDRFYSLIFFPLPINFVKSDFLLRFNYPPVVYNSQRLDESPGGVRLEAKNSTSSYNIRRRHSAMLPASLPTFICTLSTVRLFYPATWSFFLHTPSLSATNQFPFLSV